MNKGYSWTQSRFCLQLPRHLGRTASGWDDGILPPGGQVSGTAPVSQGQEASPTPAAPGALAADYFKKWAWPGPWGLGASESSWLLFSGPLTSPGEWQDSLGPQPLPSWSDRTERSLTSFPCAGHLLNFLHLLPLFPLCPQVEVTTIPRDSALQNGAWAIVLRYTLEGGAEDTVILTWTSDFLVCHLRDLSFNNNDMQATYMQSPLNLLAILFPIQHNFDYCLNAKGNINTLPNKSNGHWGLPVIDCLCSRFWAPDTWHLSSRSTCISHSVMPIS